MREIKSSISLYVHNPEYAEATVSEVEGNFYGCVKVSCETLSDLQIMFNDPNLAEDLGYTLLEMANELRKKQGEQNDTDNK
ncbi:MAG: hypothetical protein QXL01_06645 [Thermoplasmatales archaeon]